MQSSFRSVKRSSCSLQGSLQRKGLFSEYGRLFCEMQSSLHGMKGASHGIIVLSHGIIVLSGDFIVRGSCENMDGSFARCRALFTARSSHTGLFSKYVFTFSQYERLFS